MKKSSLFIYNDANHTGGHEILTVKIANLLNQSSDYKVHAAFYSPESISRLDADIEVHHLPFHSKSRSVTYTNQNHITYVQKLLQLSKAETMLVSQGYIESGVRGLLAAKLNRTRVGSYIPFGNTNRELNSRFAYPRDMISKLIFPLNDFYITISNYQATMLSRLTGDRPIHIINNPVNGGVFAPISPQSLHTPTPGRPLSIAVIGRINFKQKNQNILPAVAQLFLEKNLPVHFHLIGDGPDKIVLQSMLNDTKTNQLFSLHGWKSPDFITDLLQQIDIVLLPSHYEGLPLTFLESIYAGKPVVISNIDCMHEYHIPAHYLINPKDPNSIFNTLINLPNHDTCSEVKSIQNTIRIKNSHDTFQSDIKRVFAAIAQP